MYQLIFDAFNTFLQDPENVQVLSAATYVFEPIDPRLYQVTMCYLAPRDIAHKQFYPLFFIEHNMTSYEIKAYRLTMHPETFQLFCTLYPVQTPFYPFPYFDINLIEVHEQPHVAVNITQVKTEPTDQ